MRSLWPAKTSVLGVYDTPPPADASSIIDSREVLYGPLTEDFFNAQGLKTAKALTRLKDYLGDLVP